MSEDKNDGTQDQEDFLSGHEALLNSINKSNESANETTADENSESIEVPVEELKQDAAPEPVAQPEPTPEPPPEPIAEAEPTPEPTPEPIVEPETATEPVAQPEPTPEPIIEAEPSPEPTPEKVVVAEPTSKPEPKAAPQPKSATPSTSGGGKKKKSKAKHDHHTERNEEEKRRHEELLKHRAMEQSEVKEVLVFFQKYVKPTAIVILVVCSIFLANGFFRTNRLKKEAKADAALLQAQSSADYQDILDQYGSTPSAPLALMGLAQENFNLGKVDEADELYGRFLKKYPKHQMALQAAFNQITCKEAKGQYGEAHLLYGEFAEKHKDSHLAPVALLGKANCLESLEQFSEAKLVYEDIITFYPGSGWAQVAESKLSVILHKTK